MQDLSKHNSIKPRACPLQPEFSLMFLEEDSLHKVPFRFQRKLENEHVSPPAMNREQMSAKVRLGLEDETNGEMGYANSHKDLILEDRILTARCLNLMTKLCCLSNDMRKR